MGTAIFASAHDPRTTVARDHCPQVASPHQGFDPKVSCSFLPASVRDNCAVTRCAIRAPEQARQSATKFPVSIISDKSVHDEL